ncbi:MAG: UDP-N-acetylmuramate dehydrogenase [Treponema sp.]|nr:UDP-N-acetylmuramate dehydrogenase [Treponema sp.]
MIKRDLHGFFKKVNETEPFCGNHKFDDPMALHTTFKTGGPADLWVQPEKKIFPGWIAALLKTAGSEGIPVFILGGGANLLVSDMGIRGIVVDTGLWEGIGEVLETGAGFSVKVLSGTRVKKLTEELAGRGLSGLQFLAGMPGSAGGAVWMNARCYEKSVSDSLIETEILDENFDTVTVPFNEADFAYKKSPFQNRNVTILSAIFKVEPGDRTAIENEMNGFIRDREEKGHYLFPSAGSVFKNNRAFGEPSGKIIADLGLRGLRKGGAQIAPWHGNFFINTGNATSSDIRFLIDETISRVRAERGFELEPEVLFAGDWQESNP